MARASRTSQARAARQAKMLYDMCAMAIVAGRADLDGADEVGFDIELPMFTVGRAGELANVHPQTLRQYDRLGLVVPQRTDGGARRYSLRDIARLAKSQQLSQEEGINLAGIARILSLEEENRELRRQVERLRKPAGSSVFAADTDGDIVEIERSRCARMWRRQIQVNARQLPSRESLESARVTADAYDTPNGGVARENKGVQRGKPALDPVSRSIVLWGID
ncbi:heat shock protein transcriptional repressor HspR [Bifidobacterium catenulatum]|uniref:heat shock protein transcriptional repressor HspR n=1 Tax=Bifidobacterium catenulatum TaxID=1686 RepID=UPI0022E4C7CB|nr:helix-turn-helix transcriptional regulator [Bifidobacterium catenulatum]